MTELISSDSTKICTKCKLEKPTVMFGNAGRGDSRLRSYCKDCARVYRLSPQAVESFNKNRHKYNANRRAKYDPLKSKNEKLLQAYGISLQDYEQMLRNQGARCAICQRYEKLHVDHDHDTGVVRGLLCSSCNNGLGRFRDSVEILISAADYLSDH